MRSRSRSPRRPSRHNDSSRERDRYQSNGSRDQRRPERDYRRERSPMNERYQRERSRSIERRREDRFRPSERSGERSDYYPDRVRDRGDRYDRSKRERRRRDRSGSRERKKSCSRSRSPKASAVPKYLMTRPEITEKDLEGKTLEEQEMMKLMGFSGFESTKGKHVQGNDVSAVNVLQKRKYRQYMNRKGGFNRPLDFVA